MKIYQIFSESALRNFSYLIVWDQQAICIDPFDARQILDILQEHSLILKSIINTHEHWDHYCGNEELVRVTGCQVWAHKMAQGKIPGTLRGLTAGERIILDDDHFLEILDTPGHTFAHLCLLLCHQDRPLAVFTGDTLFNAGVGNCHSGGDPETLFVTIKEKFSHLKDDILVYPGHEYLENNLRFTLAREENNELAARMLREEESKREKGLKDKGNNINGYTVTTMGLEKGINAFLRLGERGIRENLARKFSEDLPGKEKFVENDSEKWSEKEMFVRLRWLRDKW